MIACRKFTNLKFETVEKLMEKLIVSTQDPTEIAIRLVAPDGNAVLNCMLVVAPGSQVATPQEGQFRMNYETTAFNPGVQGAITLVQKAHIGIRQAVLEDSDFVQHSIEERRRRHSLKNRKRLGGKAAVTLKRSVETARNVDMNALT